MSCQHTVDVGAYLFGSLDLEERAVFERHLGDCESCRAEMLRLAPLPGLLSRLTLEDVEDLDEIPALPPAPKRDRRVLIACAAVLVLFALAGGSFFLAWPQQPVAAPPAASPSASPPPPPRWSAKDAATGVNGEAEMVSKSWGTEMWFKLGEVRPGARCKVIVFDRRGQREVGGWWGSDHAPDERIPGSTSFRVDQIDRLEVSDESGLLVTLRP